ncbi:uncharacterized protein LOC133183302 [Saccostrea echinata]|uniref:uncharacterized protein LOC133183302 n=1 Tax=Saccostrea echinata TaxID=191078 RepID=UPI002A83875E|nr:uncharacterized protein LOC133183302 [Saccostrea echinata]
MPGGTRKMRRDKEMAAVTYNMKEDRCLEKSMQTLNLERSYSMKLLQLDHRIVKVNYKRLKDKVSRIRSYLSVDEINEMKQLEAEGKIKPLNTVNLGSAIKIAGAAKRLKIQGPTRANTSITLSSHKGSNETINRPMTANNNLRRSNSVTGVFIDAPEPNTTKRRNSADFGMTTIRPLSAFVESGSNTKPQKTKRPATSQLVLGPQSHTPRINPNPTHSPYSSHTAVEKEFLPPPRTQERTSGLTDDIDSNLGDDLMEERRQEMIMEEHERFSELEERKKDFMMRLDAYFKENPVPDWSNPPPIVKLPPSEEDKEDSISTTGSVKKSMKYRLLPNRITLDKTFRSEEEYKAKIWELWKDLNKCRYLRIPDEMLDLSGVNTLAKDQLKLFQMLKRQDTRPNLINT